MLLANVLLPFAKTLSKFAKPQRSSDRVAVDDADSIDRSGSDPPRLLRGMFID